MLIAFLAVMSMASATNYDAVRYVPDNPGPTNFVGVIGTVPAGDPGVNWIPLQVGDTFTKVDDRGQIRFIPVSPKFTGVSVNPINRLMSNSRGANKILVYDRMMRKGSLGVKSGISHSMS